MLKLLEVSSIPLAIAAFMFCLDTAHYYAKTTAARWYYAIAALCSCLLALAQSSWVVQTLAGLDTEVPINNYVWATFNLLVLVTFAVRMWVDRRGD